MHSNPMHDSKLWQSALGQLHDQDSNVSRLRNALESFRSRVEQLLKTISAELPSLTVHDISHLDALWRVASEVGGSDYPLNPAEGFVLGGAILLHDAAHVLVAYPGGLSSIKETDEWKDLIAQDYAGIEPQAHSADERSATFQVLRHLHAQQAHRLANQSWTHPIDNQAQYLIEDTELRRHYGDLIGRIAESHHWPAHRVASEFGTRFLPAPGYFQPANWTVDALKIALLLRTADAAHIDALRAPWFLFALQKPSGISLDHWRFQQKMAQPSRTDSGMLLISAGDPFSATERQSWWLAFDTAKMIDRELRDAQQILADYDRPLFAARGVLDVESPETFQRNVPTPGWTPVDVQPKVGNVPYLVAMLGGEALYGDDPSAAVRELLQNGIDAIHALRSLGGLGSDEGVIEVSLQPAGSEDYWFHVTDTGVGMSRYVLTEVLMDFGRSLWMSSALREQLPGLAASGFSSIGRFGIGFFSIFMLGDHVKVVSRRFEPATGEGTSQWSLEFENGLSERPILTVPKKEDRLARHGTRVSVRVPADRLTQLLMFNDATFRSRHTGRDSPNLSDPIEVNEYLRDLIGWLCPAADVDHRVTVANLSSDFVLRANDWKSLDEAKLCSRLDTYHRKLHPLLDESGRMIGRLGLSYSSFTEESAVTVKGVRNGTLLGLAGICEAKSSGLGAARNDALPAGKLADWTSWAESVVQAGDLERDNLIRLHPLVMRDLPVWMINDALASESDIKDLLADVTQIFLVEGDVSHESADDVSEGRFDLLQFAIKVVSYPSEYGLIRTDFAAQVGAKEIDYEKRFEALVTAEWTNASKTADWVTIGTVEGTKITRFVNIYSRL